MLFNLGDAVLCRCLVVAHFCEMLRKYEILPNGQCEYGNFRLYGAYPGAVLKTMQLLLWCPTTMRIRINITQQMIASNRALRDQPYERPECVVLE